ncbi:MAG: MFS transporter [Chitinophagales bacterium]|nr:MFS transporter [Chitinophagales bacterium]
MMNTPKRRLKFINYLGFGFGDFAFNLFFQGTTLFLLFFYTDILGIEATTAGTIFLIATIWDAITDPLMGWLAGRTNTRWGRYRPYLLLAAIPLGLSYTMMFYRPSFEGVQLFYWVLIWQLLFRTFFTMGNIPYSSLSSEMSPDTQERSQLAAYRMFLGYAGALVVSYLTGTLMQKMGWSVTTDGYFKIGLVFSLLALALFFFTYFTTFEHKTHQKQSLISWKQVLGMLSKNKPFLMLCSYIMIGMAGVVFFYQVLNYYFKYILQAPEALGIGMLALFISLMAALPAWLWLSRRWGKQIALLAGCLWLVMGSLLFYLNPLAQEQLVWTNIHLGIIGVGIGCAAFSFWALLPDTVEYGEWQSNVRAEGIIFGLGLFSLKIGLGLGSFILGNWLDFIEYVPNTAQSNVTLSGLHTSTTLCLAITALAIGLIMFRYPLSEEKHKEISERLLTSRQNELQEP